MSQFVENILVNLLSSLIFAILTILLTLLFTHLSLKSRRVKRLRVLKIDNSTSDIHLPVFTAHLAIAKGEAKLVDGQRSMHFEGSAVPIKEIEAAYSLRDELQVKILTEIPDSIRSWLMRNYRGYNKINFDIQPAPLNPKSELYNTRMIVIGGPEFNAMTSILLNKYDLFTILDAADCVNPTIKLKLNGEDTEFITPDSQNYNLGLVQRITSHENHQVILFLVGVGTNGTLSAVNWFVKNWNRLDEIFGDQNFGVVLECPKRQIDTNGYKKATVRKVYPKVKIDLI